MSRKFNSVDAINGKEGNLYLTIDGESLDFAELLKFEATVDYAKSDVNSVGRRMTGDKVIGATGVGSMTIFYHRPEMRAMALEYIKSGKQPLFDAMVVNDDPTSAAGKQTTTIKNISPDGVMIALLDADSDDTLKEDIDFTFDDFGFIDQFKVIN